MANTGDLIEAMARARTPFQPSALSFTQDRPFDTLASVGGAYATQASNLANQRLDMMIRDEIDRMIPDQRKHEIALQILKRAKPGPAQSAAIFAQHGIPGSDVDVPALIGAINRRGRGGGGRGGSKGTDKTETQLRTKGYRPVVEVGPDGTVRTRLEEYTITEKQKGRGKNEAIQGLRSDREHTTEDQAPSATQVTPTIDKTVTNLTGKYGGYDVQDKGGDKVVITAPDGKKYVQNRSVVEQTLNAK